MDVIELFAGVGGFRIGLERASQNDFHFVWANQWEPSTKKQDAYDIYVKAFGNKQFNLNNHTIYEVSNQDIATVDINDIPDHQMVCGGFPCQDYSVASTLAHSGGIEGKKGQLWWSIEKILKDHPTPAKYLFLENVDRIINSPAHQRGRDFAIILSTLANLNYIIEWRIINGAEYGMAQRRKRTYILAYKNDTAIYERIQSSNPTDWMLNLSPMAKAFPIIADNIEDITIFKLDNDLKSVSEEFGKGCKTSVFENAGILINRTVYTMKTSTAYNGQNGYTTLKDILIPEKDVPKEYYIKDEDIPKWKYLKGSKRIEKINKSTGHKYIYSEGQMTFPDSLDKPSRTIITGEGGSGPSRFKHIIETSQGKYRRLTPVELERLDGFPDNHTAGATDSRRAFLMGNALIVNVIEEIGKQLIKAINTK